MTWLIRSKLAEARLNIGAVSCIDREGAIKALEGNSRERVSDGVASRANPPVVFLFPGQGSQQRLMAAGVYRDDSGFRADFDACAEILSPHLGLDFRAALFSRDTSGTTHDFTETRLAKPALFAVEYALARFWMRRGLRPQAMIGHSVGEFVAACLAEVFSLEDAPTMVASRGRLMQELAPGTMLSVRLSEVDVRPLLNGDLSLAAVNGPALSVVSGPEAAIVHFSEEMDRRGVATKRLATSHAFHSLMVDPVVGPLTELFGRFRFRPPKLPYISCVSGDWITDIEATNPVYWARHCREPVQFAGGIQTVRKRVEEGVYLEVGPGRTLGTLTTQNLGRSASVTVISSLADSPEGQSDTLSLLQTAGALWVKGVEFDWQSFHSESRHRCPLPTYAFDKRRHWVDPPKTTLPTLPAAVGPMTAGKNDMGQPESKEMQNMASSRSYFKPCRVLASIPGWLICGSLWAVNQPTRCGHIVSRVGL